MPEMYVTFGVQYGTAEEALVAFDAGRTPPEPHPVVDWATGRGYLTVVYGVPANGDPYSRFDEAREARERARVAVHAWLDGCYAFDYDEPPTAEHAPRGEVARMVLP